MAYLPAMIEFFANLFNTTGFPPRWNCGSAWTAGHGWLHILSDAGIFGAYFAIPIVLVYFVRRRRDIPYSNIMWLFAAFILFCGIGHLVEAIIFWHPIYRVAGLLKCCTAIVSWATVAALIPIVPKLLALPGLAAINTRLEEEVEQRRQLETKMEKAIRRKEKLNRQLRDFNLVAVDRELQMIELKREINELLARLGAQPRYDVAATPKMEAGA